MLFLSLSTNGIDFKKNVHLFYFSGWYRVCWSYSIQVMTLKYFLYSANYATKCFQDSSI